MATETYTINDITRWNGYAHALLNYPSAYGNGAGELALWVEDEYLAGRVDDPDSEERYTLNDETTKVPFGRDEDLNAAIEDWKENVEWEEQD